MKKKDLKIGKSCKIARIGDNVEPIFEAEGADVEDSTTVLFSVGQEEGKLLAF